MRPKNKVKIYVYLTLSLFLVIGFITGLSYAYWMKHFEQAVANELGVSCFELTITDEENDIKLVDAKPISDEEGLELTPYTFRINNTCNTYGFVNINLEVMDLGSEVKEILPEHIHVQLTKTGIELFNDVLNLEYETDPTLVGAHLSYKLNRQFMKAKTYEDYELRIWMDKDITNDDLDTIGGSFKSKVNIIFEQTDPLFDRSGTIVPYYDYDKGINNNGKYFWQYKNTITDIIIENIENKDNYIEMWDMSQEHNGSVVAYVVDNGDDTQTLHLQGIGGIKMPESCYSFFQNFYKARSIQNIELLDFSNVTNMEQMFCYFGQNALGDINFDLSSMDASNVTNMSYMFAYLGDNSNNSINIYCGNDFNVHNLIYGQSMFYRVGSNSKGKQIYIDLGNNFNVSSLEKSGDMFAYIGLGHTNENTYLDLGDNFNACSVTNVGSYMFSNINAKNEVIVDLGKNFNLEKAPDLNTLFYYLGSLTDKKVVLNLGDNFNAKSATSARETFRYIGRDADVVDVDLGKNFGGGNLTSLVDAFNYFGYGSYNKKNTIVYLNLNSFDTSNVTNMSSAFYYVGNNAKSITIDLGDKFDTSNVTNMQNMFYYVGNNADNATIILGDKFDTSNVTNMSSMFCYSKISLNLEKFNFQSVTNLSSFGYYSPNIYGNIFINFTKVKTYNSAFQVGDITDNPKVSINYLSSTEIALDNALGLLNSGNYVGKINAKKGILLTTSPYPVYNITIPDTITSTHNEAMFAESIILEPKDSSKVIKSFKVNGETMIGNTFLMPKNNVEITDVEIVTGVIIESEHYPYPTNMYYKKYYEHTFIGANSLTIIFTYETYNTYFNWIYLYTDSSTIYQNTKFGGNLNTETITIQGDYIKIVFNNNNSYTWANDYYGFKAVIIPNYD